MEARAQRFSQDVSARASPVSLPPGTYFFKAQPRYSRILSSAQVAHSTGQPSTGIARLNSRNRLIITTQLHIVNHCSKHLTKQGFKVSEFQGFKAGRHRRRQSSTSSK